MGIKNLMTIEPSDYRDATAQYCGLWPVVGKKI